MKLLSLILLAVICDVIAEVVPPWANPVWTLTSIFTNYESSGYKQHDISKRQLDERDVREKCTPPQYPGSQSRRSLIYAGSINNVTLSRRMQLPVAGAEEQFIMNQTGADGDGIPAVWDQVDTSVKPKAYFNTNTALFYAFDQERNIVATALKGCTMLAVVIRKGVYIGHYWESIAFAMDPFYLKDGDTHEAIFQRTVIDGLKNGANDPEKTLQMSFTRFAQQFGDDFVKAYLIRPNVNSNSNADGKDGYPEEWQLMKDTVVGLLPKLGEPGRWTENIYNVVPRLGLLRTTSRGRVLFKIDPKHVQRASRRGRDTKLAILWVETREVHRDQWQDP